MQSDDGTIDGTRISEWSKLIVEAADRTGRSITVAPTFKSMMEDAGFEEVVEKIVKLPINPWAKAAEYKRLGRFTFVANDLALESVSLYYFTEVLGWSPEQVHVYLVDVRKDLAKPSIHGYWPAYVLLFHAL